MSVLDRLAADHWVRYVSHTRGDSTYEAGRKVRPVHYLTSFASVLECFVLSLYRFLRFHSSETNPDSTTDMAQPFPEFNILLQIGGDFACSFNWNR